MTAKQYLQQAYSIRNMIKAKEDKIRQLRERATSCHNRISFDPKAQSGSDKLSAAVAKICDMEVRLVADKMRLTEKEAEIIARIEALDNPLYVTLLTLRYVNYKKWKQIAVEMNYHYRAVHKAHGRALAYFSEKYKIGHTKAL